MQTEVKSRMFDKLKAVAGRVRSKCRAYWHEAQYHAALADGPLDGFMRAQRAQSGGMASLFIGLLVAAIVGFQVFIPVVQDATSNLSGTTATIAGLLPLFAFGFDLVLGQVVGPTIAVTAVFSAAMALLGGYRRSQLSDRDRLELPIETWVDELTTAVTDESTETAVVNVVLAVSILLAIGAVGVAFAVPQESTTFTDFAVGSEQDGEFVTDDYPDDLAVGETAEMAVLIENNEGEPTEYSVVARFERVEDGTVTAVEEAGEFTVTVASGETAVESHSVTRSMTGDDVRLRFFLYRGEPPTDLGGAETAYRSVHVWVDVE
jgi:uncharacterized membrane protein